MSRKSLKQTKIPISGIFVVALLVCALCLGVLAWYNVLIYDVPISVERESIGMGVVKQSDVEESIGMPVRIKIFSIDVDAAVENVGLTTDGLMDAPKQPLDTGWYELGPRPGETGSAAITGHVDWINGETAVFADLHRLKVGDKIVVEDDKGAAISFAVREIRMYDPAADATDVFTSNDGKAHLNLITCSGVWDKSAKQYSQRLVVFTDRDTE